jgi:hypothetical protein
MSDAESESLMWFLSSSLVPNPHIEPPRFLIIKKQRAIIAIGKIHHKELSETSDQYMGITSF